MSNPEPIPVEVMAPAPTELPELLELVGEMTELMGFSSARYVGLYIGNIRQDLKQAAYQTAINPKL
jgi:hypothetical protein